MSFTIATIGPAHSHAWQAARRYAPEALLRLYPHLPALLQAFVAGEVERVVLPVYNTREGENREQFRLWEGLTNGHWIDNVVLPDHLSLGVAGADVTPAELRTLVGRPSVLRQCEEYLAEHFPDLDLLSVHDIDSAAATIRQRGQRDHGLIESEELLQVQGFHLLEREVAPHNRTRYAVLGKEPAPATGYDATVIVTVPLSDRVGMLVDILGEFSRRGINILDMRAESDIKTQKLRIYLEAEGHISEPTLTEALRQVEDKVVQQPRCLRVLGSFPRVDMRTKFIRSFGFIGTGAMSGWFADRLAHEGYQILLSGRSTELTPEAMIAQVDVVMICVPISATVAAVERYGPLIRDGQALILLAGESETTLASALIHTGAGVEIMLVHNLWGPQAATMKDKNAIVVRTPRSGRLCSEFEAFLYKHGADIWQDSPSRHDLLMGIGQKLPTMVSVALAMTLQDNSITGNDIASHCTLTSLYGILAMARAHSQNPRTYAEIMATAGDGRKVVRDFARNLAQVLDMAEAGRIDDLSRLIDLNSAYLGTSHLQNWMNQARILDEVLGRAG
ncbi:MAG: prephenate dehydratase [Desulfobulbaceae bacterium A2]|nr:MAG: prephenate dehydratase [Desulfobulbaceae bacterium A2]